MKKAIILGAAGRDFHNFNMLFRNNRDFKVVCFTAAQIPNIAGRKYPAALAGRHYPKGIKIYPEKDLPKLIKKYNVDVVFFSYSDVTYSHVMHVASLVNSCGADFQLVSPESTMIKSKKPVIAVTAVRTGCGKSQATQKICDILRRRRKMPVVIRHPMPYGDLKKQTYQRFATLDDLKRQECTIEEMEEYMPHISRGNILYAGVDYQIIAGEAEKEADVIVFDGGNNDFPFFVPDVWIVLLDPLRPGHEISYYPGEINLRMADIALINKESSARRKNIERVRSNIKAYNPRAKIVDAESVITIENPMIVKNRKVLVVEDGPTLTHGEMRYGAGFIAAKRVKAMPVNPRNHAVGSLKEIYRKYPKLGPILPAMGYSKKQVRELERTINNTPCDAVISATPVDLTKILRIKKPIVKISYTIREKGEHRLEHLLKKVL